MKILIDANLTPLWATYLTGRGIESLHWSDVGPLNAPDPEIMAYALARKLILFTHDLDFGSILAATNATGPSVIQVRTQDPVPAVIGELVVSTVREYARHLENGALITIEPERRRARVLPMFRKIE